MAIVAAYPTEWSLKTSKPPNSHGPAALQKHGACTNNVINRWLNDELNYLAGQSRSKTGEYANTKL